ncbi:TadE family type IV pilus minor pilin [Dermacoccaceae bacterium W4C1]
MSVRSRAGGDGGMVSAELATALGAVVAVLTLALSATVAGVDQIRATDAARVAARAAARGDDAHRVRQVAERAAPPGASVVISRTDQWVVVTVTAPLRGPVGALTSAQVRAESVAVQENSATEARGGDLP